MALTDQLVREKGLTTLMVTHNLKYAVNHGTRLLMMHQGKAVIDASGPDRAKYSVDDLLDTFNQISIEVGNYLPHFRRAAPKAMAASGAAFFILPHSYKYWQIISGMLLHERQFFLIIITTRFTILARRDDMKREPKKRPYKILSIDPWLAPFERIFSCAWTASPRSGGYFWAASETFRLWPPATCTTASIVPRMAGYTGSGRRGRTPCI